MENNNMPEYHFCWETTRVKLKTLKFVHKGLCIVAEISFPVQQLKILLKGIVTDSNNIFLCHESEDINKKSLFPKFQLIPSSNFQVMHDYVCFIAPIDYCVE